MDFDPYLKWLGIRDPNRPPNHYRLLGLDLFESDDDVISSAADRQMAHVRRHQVGKHAELSQKLLNEIAAARLCLLDHDQRSIYDRSLRQSQRVTTAAAKANRKSTSSTIPYGIAVFGLLTILAAVFVVARSRITPKIGQTEPSTKQEVIAPAVEPKVTSEPPKPNIPAVPPPEINIPTLPASNTNPWIRHTRAPEQPIEFKSAFLASLAQRKIENAKSSLTRQLENMSPAQTSQAKRLLAEIEQFWTAVQDTLDQLKVGSIFEYREQPVQVRSIAHNSLTLTAGDGSSLAFKTSLEKMEGDLAISLSKISLRATGTDQERIIRSFNECESRNISRLSGLDSVGNTTLVESSTDNSESISRQPPNEPNNPRQNETARTLPPIERWKVPDAAEVIAERKRIRGSLGSNAKTSLARSSLSQELLQTAEKRNENSVRRYALLRESMRLATAAGNVTLLWKVTEKISSDYDIDTSQDMLERLPKVARSNKSESARIFSTTNVRLQMAVIREDFELAHKYQRVLYNIAKQTRDAQKSRQYQSLAKQLKTIESAWRDITVEIEQLKLNPNDAALNSRVGLFTCLLKRDQKKGLRMFAKSDREDLRNLARLESTQASPIRLGDAWWDLASKEKGLSSANARRIALEHFSKGIVASDKVGRSEILAKLRLRSDSDENTRRLIDLGEATTQTWRVDWSNHPNWDSLTFESNGKARVIANGKPRLLTWNLKSGTIEIVEAASNATYLLSLRTAGRISCIKLGPDSSIATTGTGTRKAARPFALKRN